MAGCRWARQKRLVEMAAVVGGKTALHIENPQDIEATRLGQMKKLFGVSALVLLLSGCYAAGPGYSYGYGDTYIYQPYGGSYYYGRPAYRPGYHHHHHVHRPPAHRPHPGHGGHGNHRPPHGGHRPGGGHGHR